MSMVRSIDIVNNTFINERAVKGGIAIESMDAGYHVHKGTTGNSTFEGWNYGINAKGGCSINTFKVEETNFEKCNISILVEAVDNFETTNNTFEIGANGSIGSTPGTEIGIMTDFCTGYDIAFNTFVGNNAGNSINNSQPIGVIIKDSGNGGNRVEVNTYTGCYIANLSNGDNTEQTNSNGIGGLQYLCNVQSNNINDVSIPDENGVFGVALFQGFLDESAGNTFSSTSTAAFQRNIENHDFTSPLDRMRYFFQQGSTGQFPNQTYGVDRISIDDPAECSEEFTNGGGPGDGKTIGIGLGLQAAENNYKEFEESIESNNISVEQKARLAGLKSKYDQYVNFAIFSQAIGESRNYQVFETYLNKKSINESKFLRLAMNIENSQTTKSTSAINSMSGEDYGFYNLFHNNVKDNEKWKDINKNEKSNLQTLASAIDNRSSMAAVNVLEYYFDQSYDKEIILPDGIIIREGSPFETKEFERAINVFPNPVNSITQISFDKVFNGEIKIFGVKGNIVQEFNVEKTTTFNINVEALQNGIYILRFQDNLGQINTRKLIVQ